ncbi:hypothetical protein [Streptomyces sp. x-80]|uniref:hypothetical protein n=1 Tax=Streptomyces sp. x-80 TaxID=2789282 RepID=UPI00398167C6
MDEIYVTGLSGDQRLGAALGAAELVDEGAQGHARLPRRLQQRRHSRWEPTRTRVGPSSSVTSE